MKTVTIPIEPPEGLLISMATRYNHAFGISSGLTDEQIQDIRTENPLMGSQYLTSGEREVILKMMRQIHEEVVGKGFYRYEGD